MAVAFDTLGYSRRLRAAGVSDLEYQLKIWIGGTLAVSIGVVAALTKLL
jgi:hypothetical protein